LNAPNFIVDSNIETPATYGPKAVHLGAHFCNDGSNDLTDVLVNIGDFIGTPSASTPGVYPVETVDEIANGWGYNGDFSLTHGTNNLSEATRLIGTIPAGECNTQYWMITYPQLDAGGNAVFGANSVFEDDLVLDYDFWATANDGGSSLTADQTYSATMRRELSAAANKIWPNTTSKVPNEYLDAIEGVLGWRPTTGSENTTAGGIGTVSGIWYDFGVVNKGFDNDGDLIPDYNAWAQPVGDPAIFDSACFKLIKTYGILIVKHNTGFDELIPFVDELYFSNIASDNTGMVGLVFYDFQALDGTCSIQISPYQEVASGRDNEKFNGDYGTFTGYITSTTPEVTFDKVADKTTVALGDTIEYDLTADNTAGTIAVGDASLGSPLVFHDTIPSGTLYVGGTADAGNSSTQAGLNFSVLYSVDNGTTWSSTEPAIATDTTDLQWWLDAPLEIGETATVTFTTTVPLSYPDLFVINDASLGFGSSSSFAFDDEIVYIEGTLSISGTVFEDDGSGGGTSADGILNGSEPGHGSVTLSLYLDLNGDGIIDAGEPLWDTTASAVDGTYSFTNLPDGDFIVLMDKEDPDLFTGSTTGWGLTTGESIDVTLACSDVTGIDFGIAPALEITKTLNGTSPVGEGTIITYNIGVRNLLADTNGGTGLATCEYDSYATNVLAAKSQIVDEANAVVNTAGSSDEPEGSFAVTSGGGDGYLAVNQFDILAQPEAITKVELVFLTQSVAATWVDDVMDFQLRDNADTPLVAGQLTTAQLNALSTTTNTEVILDVTSAFSWDFNTSVTEDLHAYVEENKTASSDSDIRIDAVSLRFTTDCGGGGGTYDINKTLSPVPLNDTFDATYLQFVSSVPSPDAFDNGAGTLSWNDVGPLNAGASRTIQVKFRTQLPGATGATNVLNTAFSNNTFFANGLPSNTDTDDALVDIDPRVELGGTVWNDSTGSVNGWSGAVGYEGGDTFISGVTVNLYACLDLSGNIYTANTGPNPASGNKTCGSVQNPGAWTVVDTTTTDTNGDYLFTGMTEGYYYVEVDNSTLPGTVTQAADPDETPGTCSTCDDIWQDPTANLNTFTYVPAVPGDISNINFGYNVNPALYGNVWEDKDGDGTQEIGDLPLSGWTVELQSAGCTPGVNCPTTTTDANGDYSFGDLNTATAYTLSITALYPGDTTWVETFESDGSENNAITITLSAGEISGSHDFAFQHTGSSTIGDLIYADWDGDGVHDGAGEEGIPGVTVNLYEYIDGDGVLDISVDPFITSTSGTGSYLFSNLPAGDFFVVVDETTLPTGYSQSGDPNETGTCSLCDARDYTSVDGTNSYLLADFGFVPSGLASIGDLVFNDIDGDGIVDLGDTGIPNIGIDLQVDVDGNGTYVTVRSTTTDADGLYLFDNLPDANYRVIVDSNDTDLPNDTYGNDGLFTTATQIDIVISGAENLTADFGYTVLGSIGDTIFQDDNGNAAQDTLEPGIANVTVDLYIDVNGDGLLDGGDTFQSSTSTADGTGSDPLGSYFFTQLPPNDYLVVVNTGGVLTGFTQTGDPDRDGENCTSTTYPALTACDNATGEPINYNVNYMGADFGYQPPGAFGDQVWNDLNNDGIKDANEPGLANVTISIFDGTDTFITTTDNDGLYSFGNLANGTWTVTVTDTNNVLTNYTPVYDPDATANGITTVVISGGTVTDVGTNLACTNCELTVDFGYQLNGAFDLTGSICFEDAALDGTCDNLGGDDSGVTIQPVYLYDSGGVLLASTNTDVNGDYSFTSLPADTYQVAVGTTLAPLSFGSLTTTTGNSGFNGTLNSLTNSGTSVIQNITIAASSVDLDFAFDLIATIDFGDLPAPYSTTLSTGGAYHILDPVNTLFLGPNVADTESDGIATINADGDGADDSDGIGYGTISSWTNGANGGIIQLQVGGTLGAGYVAGWIDFNGDGDFTDVNERVVSSSVSNGFAYFNITIPAGASLDSQIYSRFRVFETEPPLVALSYNGAYSKGEVEDYLLDFRVPGSIGDSVWLDEDGDGIEDIFEPGIANVLVELQDGTCTPTVDCLTTITDANGQYLFTDVYAGNYTVDIVSGIPAGLTTAPGTTDPNGAFALANGENKLDVDFGYVPTGGTAIIGDQVFLDANSNGVQDPGEVGIAGVTLELQGNGCTPSVDCATTTTLVDGSYLFTNVAPEDYIVEVTDTFNVLSGYTVTTSTHTPIDSITDPITLLADTIYTDADFGYVTAGLSSYTDRVWLDANNDSAFSGEQGIGNVTINLVDGLGNVVATTVSGSDGIFSFTGLPNGVTYSVVVADNNNALGTLDATTTEAMAGFVSITTAGTNVDVSSSNPSFGYYEPGGVSGLLWSDADGDGVRDNGEAAISGITIELQGTGCISGSTCPTTTTAIDGTYIFDGFLPTNYTVVVNPVAGSGTVATGYITQTGDPDEAGTCVTCNNNTPVTITAGTIDENNDFGYQNTNLFDISGTIFYDTDSDGTYEINGDDGDAGTTVDNEYGLSSVTVELQDGSGNVIATTIAAGDGTYSFPDLPDGNYTVVVTDTNLVLSGYEATSGLDYRNISLAGADVTDVDFGYVDDPLTASIGDFVWLDGDGDGIQDPDELGLSSVSLNLYEDTNNNGVLDIGTGDTLITSETTDANGFYRFDSLSSGNYFVDIIEADVPSNLTATTFVSGISSLVGLSEGEIIEDIDFGFAPDTGTGVLSGLVWSDDDSNGIANAGEVGIGDGSTIVTITVTDINNPVTTYTTESDPDGSWIVTNLPPGDYAVNYSSSDIPGGYVTPTQPTNFPPGDDTYTLSLAANQTINNLDFGFDPGAATGAISGTIYNDLDKNSNQNGSEPGIWDVSINLIESVSGTVVSSMFTDINGDYAFTGIPAGTYELEISDINGTLDELNQFETFLASYVVVAGATTTDVDAGFASGNDLGSIGNLVFLDVDNSGDFQIGEPGIEGVSLECWSDTNENNVLEPGIDNLIRTVVTDENGEYYCNSVPSGLYVVSVTDRDGRLVGFTSTGSVNTFDVDNYSNITPLPIQTSSPNYKADFGYRGTRTISGHIFEDSNNNGDVVPNPEVGESLIQNGNVYLYNDLNNNGVLDGNEPRIATQTTDMNGFYEFTNIPEGNYILSPNVSGTPVAGYSQTTQSTSNGIIAVTLGPNSTNNDFGFYNNGVTTTPVTLSSFSATTDSNGTQFEWTTESETGNIGFKLLKVNNSGELTPLTGLIKSHVVNSLESQTYSLRISRNDLDQVWIVDIDIYGNETKHGPFEMNKQYGSRTSTVERINWASIRQQHYQLQNQRRLQVQNANTIDFSVSKDAIYRVTYDDLINANFNVSQLKTDELKFKLNGSNVPVYIFTNGSDDFGPGSWIEFIGKKVNDNIYTETNLYRLTRVDNNRGDITLIEDNNTLFDSIDHSVYHKTHQMRDENLKYSFTAPSNDPWFRDTILAYGSDANKEYTFNVDELINQSAHLKFEIWGGTDFLNLVDHHIQITLNGSVVFDDFLDGLDTVNSSIQIPKGLLVQGTNTLVVNAILETDIDYSLINVNWVGIEYYSDLTATDNYIEFYGLTDLIFENNFEEIAPNNSGIKVYQINDNQASVYAYINNKIVRLSALVYEQETNGGGSVAFADVSPNHHYVVSSESAIITPSLSPVLEPTDILSGNANYLMISHPDFIDTLNPLKMYHESNGLTVKIVNIEDIYFKYNGGVVNPDAISDYINEANNVFNLEYVLLVGADTYDYLNHLGLGSFSFIPSHYAQTDEYITYTPTDVPFVDFNNDNVQDLAIGRFPSRTVNELEFMINKTLQYANRSYTKSSVFAADINNGSGNFSLKSDALIQNLTSGWSVTRAYLDNDIQINTTSLLIDEINNGISLVNYFGHSGPSTWSFESLLGLNDIQSLNNIEKPTVVVQWGCWNAYHVTANANTMAHRFLVNGNGAAAVLGASTLTKIDSDSTLGNLFISLASQKGITVGNALMQAKQEMARQNPEYLDTLLGYMILGDPAIELNQ